MCICVYAYMCICVYVYVCMYVCVCVCVCVCNTYTHTHTHTHLGLHDVGGSFVKDKLQLVVKVRVVVKDNQLIVDSIASKGVFFFVPVPTSQCPRVHLL